MKNLIFAFLGLILVAACTAKPGSVANNPPRIEKPELKTMSFGVEFGKFKPNFMSVLLWPKDWTEQETEDRVYTINKFSRYSDSMVVEATVLGAQIPALMAKFPPDQCAKLKNEDGSWISVTQVAGSDLELYNGCVDLQNKMARVSEIQNGNPEELARISAECPQHWGPVAEANGELPKPRSPLYVAKMVDCILGEANQIRVNADASWLSILPSEDGHGRAVAIRFSKFNGSEANQETPKATDKTKEMLKAEFSKAYADAKILEGDELLKKLKELGAADEALKRLAKYIQNATIDKDGRRLQFDVPDMRSELVTVETPSGPEYHYRRVVHFDLFRVENLLPAATPDENGALTDLAKFKGDVAILEDGVEVQKGSGQLLGQFTAAPRP